MGVPVVIGAGGVERIVEIKLNARERAMFNRSVEAVRKVLDVARGLMPESPARRRAAGGRRTRARARR